MNRENFVKTLRLKKSNHDPSKNRFKTNNTDRCWGCGKIGHRAKDCPTTNKKKDKINMLELEKEVKNKLYSILGENENNSSSDENLSDDDHLNIAYSSDDSKSSDSCECGSAICTCKNHFINVITSTNKETFFDMIDRIEDPDFKKKILN
ncbi:hypothetical protein H5410_056815 [Solanum commersonii]|uniref:CCHC-type domain-containing protein n=1 Tax=Solanum commersonii TaxID=4109 RepID=A0A9J5WL90_SOLCO|nr:hypothetical protein H5410_056815 [Solanum commersonii]